MVLNGCQQIKLIFIWLFQPLGLIAFYYHLLLLFCDGKMDVDRLCF